MKDKSKPDRERILLEVGAAMKLIAGEKADGKSTVMGSYFARRNIYDACV